LWVTARRVADVLDRVAAGVREDAFGSDTIDDASSPELITVVTPLERGNEFLSTGNLDQATLRALARITNPSDPDPGPVPLVAQQMKGVSGDMNFVVFGDAGRFAWVHRLLRAGERNAKHLRCYHNNTLQSGVLLLQQTEFARGLIGRAKINHGILTPDLRELLVSVTGRLVSPPYRSASLREFQRSDVVTRVLEDAKELLK
jgi:hypothetical protein